MVTPDRIRLTGLLRKEPWKRGFFYACDSPATRQARPAAGLTAVSVEPPGAVARDLPGVAPHRTLDATSACGRSQGRAKASPLASGDEPTENAASRTKTADSAWTVCVNPHGQTSWMSSGWWRRSWATM
jgi:hypothetical protein